ncbi:hypothetical protein EK904_001427 [Melospiza melodia maxima]|nr:hypothetical protein EK904_001427 [Melospiza melodia maxima]
MYIMRMSKLLRAVLEAGNRYRLHLRLASIAFNYFLKFVGHWCTNKHKWYYFAVFASWYTADAETPILHPVENLFKNHIIGHRMFIKEEKRKLLKSSGRDLTAAKQPPWKRLLLQASAINQQHFKSNSPLDQSSAYLIIKRSNPQNIVTQNYSSPTVSRESGFIFKFKMKWKKQTTPNKHKMCFYGSSSVRTTEILNDQLGKCHAGLLSRALREVLPELPSAMLQWGGFGGTCVFCQAEVNCRSVTCRHKEDRALNETAAVCDRSILSNLKQALCWCSFEGDFKESPGHQGRLSAWGMSVVCTENRTAWGSCPMHQAHGPAFRRGSCAPSEICDVCYVKNMRFGPYSLVANPLVCKPGLQHSSHQEHFAVSDGVRSLTDPEQGVLQQQRVCSPIGWLCLGLPPHLPSHSHTVPPNCEKQHFHGCARSEVQGAAVALSESAGPLEDLKCRRHSVYGLDLLQLCVCWLLLVSSYCLVRHLSLKGAILFSSGIDIVVYKKEKRNKTFVLCVANLSETNKMSLPYKISQGLAEQKLTEVLAPNFFTQFKYWLSCACMGMLLGCPGNSQDVQDVQQQVQRYSCTALATVSVPVKNMCLTGVLPAGDACHEVVSAFHHCSSSEVYASSEKHVADAQDTGLHCRWEHLEQSAQCVQSPLLSAMAHEGMAEWQKGKTDWSCRVHKGFARLSEAVPHCTEGYQCVQGYIKISTSSCNSFGGSCKLAKHLALVTGLGHCQADQRLELYKGHTSVVLEKAF